MHYMLFTIWETPQASTGFMPFELLIGQRPRGLLDVATESWEDQPAPFLSVIDYVQDLQQWIKWVVPTMKEHMQMAQREQ